MTESSIINLNCKFLYGSSVFLDLLFVLEDGVFIETNAFKSLLTCFDKSSWTYRYALASWFYKSLVSYKREVSSILFFDFSIYFVSSISKMS